jgi:hypothetical protein
MMIEDVKPATSHCTQYDPLTSAVKVGEEVVAPVRLAELPTGVSVNVQE